MTTTLLLILLIGINSLKGQDLKIVGVSSLGTDTIYALQEKPQWCWAACIQMTLNGYGIDISQEDIVRRTYGMDPYGRLPNWPGSFENIHQNLNNWSMDRSGNPYVVRARFQSNAPSPMALINELSQGRPVLIGYVNGNSGHAVLITAVAYEQTQRGPIIHTITVRDPYPYNESGEQTGKITYNAQWLAKKISANWFIRIRR